MKKYELLATLKPNLDNEEADKVVAKVEELQKRAISYVSAKSQAKILDNLLENNILKDCF